MNHQPFVTRIEEEPQHSAGGWTGIDELVTGPVDSVHIERMDNGCYWIGINKGAERQVVFLRSSRKITARTAGDQ